MKIIYLINGPNLDRLGAREPDIYGTETLVQLEAKAVSYAYNYGYKLKAMQSNSEGQLIDFIHEACKAGAASIIINAAAYSHSSIAILDALTMFEGYVIEVHISNIYKREEFRRHSYCSFRADAIICGCGTQGYFYAIDYVCKKIKV